MQSIHRQSSPRAVAVDILMFFTCLLRDVRSFRESKLKCGEDDDGYSVKVNLGGKVDTAGDSCIFLYIRYNSGGSRRLHGSASSIHYRS